VKDGAPFVRGLTPGDIGGAGFWQPWRLLGSGKEPERAIQARSGQQVAVPSMCWVTVQESRQWFPIVTRS
jgi:hypothetical protein